MRRWVTMMISALLLTSAYAGAAAAAETAPKSRFMGAFKGSYRDSYPQAILVKRFLITNGAYAVKSSTIGDANIIQKMSEKVVNDFIIKGSESCTSQYYVIEEIATEWDYHPDASLLLHSDANVVCFNTRKPL